MLPTAAELEAIGVQAGLCAVGVTSAAPFEGTRVDLETRKAAGLDGGMQFTYRNPERSTTPRRILDTARTLIVGAWPYAAHPRTGDAPSGPRGEVAAFAWRDHYAALRSALDVIAEPRRADHHAHVSEVGDIHLRLARAHGFQHHPVEPRRGHQVGDPGGGHRQSAALAPGGE